MRGAGAVIHSHGIETCIATMLNPGAKEFRVNPLVHVSISMRIYVAPIRIRISVSGQYGYVDSQKKKKKIRIHVTKKIKITQLKLNLKFCCINIAQSTPSHPVLPHNPNILISYWLIYICHKIPQLSLDVRDGLSAVSLMEPVSAISIAKHGNTQVLIIGLAVTDGETDPTKALIGLRPAALWHQARVLSDEGCCQAMWHRQLL